MTVKEELHVLIESLNDAEAVEALDLLRSVVTANGDEEEHLDEQTAAILARAKPFTFDDPLWGIVGMIDDDGPTDVSENTDRYLADAYADLHER